MDDAIDFLDQIDYLEKLAKKLYASSIDFEKDRELLSVYCGNDCVAKCSFQSGYVINQKKFTNLIEAEREIKEIVYSYPY